MVVAGLLKYIQNELKKGFSEELIREALKIRGYIQQDVDEGFSAVKKLGQKIEEIPEAVQKIPSFFESRIQKIPQQMEQAANIIRFDKHKIQFKREWVYVFISIFFIGIGYYYVHEAQVVLKGINYLKILAQILYKALLLAFFIFVNGLFIKYAFKIVKEGAPLSKVWDTGFVLGLFLLVFSFIPYVKWLSFALFNFLLIALLKKHFSQSNLEMAKIWGLWILFWMILAALMATFLYLL